MWKGTTEVGSSNWVENNVHQFGLIQTSVIDGVLGTQL